MATKWSRLSWVFLALAMPVSGFGASYEIDPAHSSVNFTIRHLIGKVQGSFQKFSGKFEFDSGKPAKWKAEATIDVASINTNVEKRDQHLRSKDFFDVENKEHPDYAAMKFVSTKVTDVKDNKGKLRGNLTIHGVTKPVVLDLDIAGEATDPWGNKKAGFSATTTINRKDFGLTWNQTLETGGVLVGDDVVITLEIEGNKK